MASWSDGAHGHVAVAAEDPEAFEWDEPEDVEDIDDGEVFDEVKTKRFLVALGLPLPAELS